MSAEDLHQGLGLPADPAVLDALGEGAFSAFTGLDLTGDEAGESGGAASECLEVVGFDVQFGFMNLGLGGSPAISPLDEKANFSTAQNSTASKAQAADKGYASINKLLAT